MLNFIKESLADKTVLLTGHTGFKGSWLALWLARLGARVTGIAFDPPTDPSHFELAGVLSCLQQHVIHDVRDVDRLTALVQDIQPDLIMHLAAQSVVRRGYREPWETFSTNVMGTASVLEAIRRWGQPCAAVIVTSDKCYDNREQVWGYRENDPLGDHDPYGGSKGAAELVVRAYRDSYFPVSRIGEHSIRIASARAGNVIGGGDWTPDALVVDMVLALARGETIRVRSPHAFRPWQHVLQALSGYLLLGAKLVADPVPTWCEGWNIGPLPGNEIPVWRVVETFLEEWGTGDWVDVSDPDDPREATILRLSIDKALWKLHWHPGWDVAETIQKTAEWYRHWLIGDVALQTVSLRQIEEYEDLLQQKPLEISALDSGRPATAVATDSMPKYKPEHSR